MAEPVVEPRVYRLGDEGAGEDAVYVGRQGGCEWGNPFAVGKHGGRGECIRAFESYLKKEHEFRVRGVRVMRGKNLVCHCALKGGVGIDDPLICHGQIWLRAVRGDYD